MSTGGVSDNSEWKILSREIHFRNPHLEVATISALSPTRSAPKSWTIVHRKKAVVVAPMTSDGKLVLIRQERMPVLTTLWEFPAGQIDDVVAGNADPGHSQMEEIKAVALRELKEETGFELAPAGELLDLGDFFSSAGFTDECAFLFLARPVHQSATGHAHEESESILDCRAFSPAEIRTMIDRNEIRDANTLSTCARLVARGLLSFEL